MVSSTVVPSPHRSTDQLPRPAAGGRVEAGRRLVEEQQLGPSDDAEGEIDPPPLTARQRADALAGLLVEADQLEHLVGVAATPVARLRTARSPRRRRARPRSRTTAARSRSDRAAHGRRVAGRCRAPTPRRPCGHGALRGSRPSSTSRHRCARAARTPRPACTSNDRSSTATIGPYVLRSRRTSIAAMREVRSYRSPNEADVIGSPVSLRMCSAVLTK